MVLENRNNIDVSNVIQPRIIKKIYSGYSETVVNTTKMNIFNSNYISWSDYSNNLCKELNEWVVLIA